MVLPIVALLLFAVIQFGIAFNHYLALTDAVRAGARVGSVGRFSPDPAGATESAVRRSAVNLDQSSLAVQVTAPGGWQRGTDVTVSASYPYAIDLLGVVLKSGELESTVTERVE